MLLDVQLFSELLVVADLLPLASALVVLHLFPLSIADFSPDWDSFEFKVFLQSFYKEAPCILWKIKSTRHKYCKCWWSALDLGDVAYPG